MRAKILRQNMQQSVLGLLKINVELLLLFLNRIIEVEERAPGQTPPVIQRVQNSGRLISQQGVGGPEGVPQLDHPPARGARRRGRVIELADFQCVVAVCLVVVCRQKRRPSVHAVKHRSTSRTNTDVSVRSAE